jgi:hypothetical protein
VLRAAVLDEGLRPVRGLTREAFIAEVDGQPAEVLSVSEPGPALAVALLIDTSFSVVTQSVQGGNLEKAVIKSFIEYLQTGDRASLAGISEPKNAPAPSADRRALRRALAELRDMPDRLRAAGSPIWDAVFHTARRLAAEPGRRAIILHTDGRSTGNEHGFLEAMRQVILAEASVTVLAEAVEQPRLLQTPETIAVIQPSVLLEQMADETGGQMFRGRPPPKVKGRQLDFGLIVEYAIDAVRASYDVAVPIPADGKFHRVALRALPAEYRIHAPKLAIVR